MYILTRNPYRLGPGEANPYSASVPEGRRRDPPISPPKICKQNITKKSHTFGTENILLIAVQLYDITLYLLLS